MERGHPRLGTDKGKLHPLLAHRVVRGRDAPPGLSQHPLQVTHPVGHPAAPLAERDRAGTGGLLHDPRRLDVGEM